MGPEHSSARLERFLQLCAEKNMIVGNFTTPAQYFHALRRQKKRRFRKPMILMTPKSLLTRAEAVSDIEDLLEGSCFQEVLPDPKVFDRPSEVVRIVFCSGKVYYDLAAHREENGIRNTAILRIEQLYPFHKEMIGALISSFPNASKFVWCQEEPRNQGAWYWLASRQHLVNVLGAKRKLLLVSRPAAASPAVGYYAKHNQQQKEIIENAFGPIQD